MTKDKASPISDAVELKPCPGCNGRNLTFNAYGIEGPTEGPQDRSHEVVCDDCGWSGPERAPLAAAIAAWNRRASDAALSDERVKGEEKLPERCPECGLHWGYAPPAIITGTNQVRCIECKNTFTDPAIPLTSPAQPSGVSVPREQVFRIYEMLNSGVPYSARECQVSYALHQVLFPIASPAQSEQSEGVEVVAWRLPVTHEVLGQTGWSFYTREVNPDDFEPGEHDKLVASREGAEPLVRLTDYVAMRAERDRHAKASAKSFGIEKLGWLDHWKARAEAAEARLSAVEGALEPFGEVGRAIDGVFGHPLFPDDDTAFNHEPGCVWSVNGTKKRLTWGDFRRAFTALSTKEQDNA